jgi:hypothetical protein
MKKLIIFTALCAVSIFAELLAPKAGQATVDQTGSTLAVISNNGSAQTRKVVPSAYVVGCLTNTTAIDIYIDSKKVYTIPAGSQAGWTYAPPGIGHGFNLAKITAKAADASSTPMVTVQWWETSAD